MDYIKQKLLKKGEEERLVVKRLISEFGSTVLESVTLDQVLTGMKGITGLLTVTSKLDPNTGITYRGYTIPEIQQILPKVRPEGEPLSEGLFYLFLLNEIPTKAEVDALSKEWVRRSELPEHVIEIMDAMPLTSKPMTQFSTAILAMATESKFQKAHRDGLHKNDYWDTTFEDVMDLIARLPVVAAYIYRKNFVERFSLSRSKCALSPPLFTTVSSRSWMRSKVVNRAPQALHWRRLRTAPPSSTGRESFTWLSSEPQNGQCIEPLPASTPDPAKRGGVANGLQEPVREIIE